MNKYNVTVTETFEKTISVEASSTEEAIHTAANLWKDNDAALNSPPFKGVRYEVTSSRQA